MNMVVSDTNWRALSAQQARMAMPSNALKYLFEQDPLRVISMTRHCGSLSVDFSKHLVDQEAMQALLVLADERNLPAAIQAMFDGAGINNTESRPALHVALRGHVPELMPEVAGMVSSTLERIAAFVNQVQSGDWKGYSQQRITTVVNIGIGGSDLGPAMVTAALRPFHHAHLRCHFVSNVDPAHIRSVLKDLQPDNTLFIIASKTFTTLETLSNARLAKAWYLSEGGSEQDIHRHFVAVSSNVSAAESFGIRPENIFPMWDWVGGRYSLWSAIGLSIALATSMPVFTQLLAGAAEADSHFLQTPLPHNIPVIMGLLAVWYRNFWQCDSHVVLPYAQDLHLLPAFLQQLEMESLGKSVDRNGHALENQGGPVIWGSAGTNGQHSFHQLLHQGTTMIPADFIAVASTHCSQDLQAHQHLLANCLAQSRALMLGKSFDEAHNENTRKGMAPEQANLLAKHRQVPGNRPSSTFIMQSLDARSLGILLALYEHKVFVQSVIWNLNAFDQWGVEIGKQLSGPVFDALSGDTAALSTLDESSQHIIQLIQTLSGKHPSHD